MIPKIKEKEAELNLLRWYRYNGE